MSLTVRSLIERQAAERPEAVYALGTEGGAPISYRRLAADSAAVGATARRRAT